MTIANKPEKVQIKERKITVNVNGIPELKSKLKALKDQVKELKKEHKKLQKIASQKSDQKLGEAVLKKEIVKLEKEKAALQQTVSRQAVQKIADHYTIDCLNEKVKDLEYEYNKKNDMIADNRVEYDEALRNRQLHIEALVDKLQRVLPMIDLRDAEIEELKKQVVILRTGTSVNESQDGTVYNNELNIEMTLEASRKRANLLEQTIENMISVGQTFISWGK